MENTLNVRDLHPGEIESVRLFLQQHGWGHRVGSPEHFAHLIHNSQRTAVALKDAQIIGFARGISDGLSNGYLSMVVVDDHHRREGVGRALVEHVMGDNPESGGAATIVAAWSSEDTGVGPSIEFGSQTCSGN